MRNSIKLQCVLKKDVDLTCYDERVKLANNVKAIRKALKLTQAQLAHYCCTTLQCINRIETCSGEPEFYTVARIASFSGKSFKELFS